MNLALPPEGQDPAGAPVEATLEPRQEPRPEVPANVRSFVQKLWSQTNDVPDHDAAVRAARESHKTLFPAWFDRTDRYRGTIPKELRTRADDRKVRTNLAYKYIQQSVAMTVPDDHGVQFEAIPMVGSEDGVGDPAVERFAETIGVVVEAYAKEAGFHEVVQTWVQDAFQYRIACLKVVFDRNFLTDSVRASGESRDQQDNIARLAALAEDFSRKVFNDSDARYHEMMLLKESLGTDGELRVWAGLRTENVPIDCVRFDPTIRSFENIYQAGWISHDVFMSCAELKAKYPYKPMENGDWTGIHPDDLAAAEKRDSNDPKAQSSFGDARERGKGPSPHPDAAAENDRWLVREVWSRTHNRVFILVEGIEYPVATWVPAKTPAQWYPFRFLRANRVTGQVYGISDVELMTDIQNRINRKRSDEEKARWLMLPRGIYNTQGVDQEEINKLRDINPGELKGLNLMGAKISEVVEMFNFPFDIKMFDTAKDEFEMQQMSAIPAQMLGATGQAEYAAEVEAGMQGASISANDRGARIRRTLEDTYKLIAEILLQELTADDVHDVAGPMAFWPNIYGEGEALRIVDGLKQQATQAVMQNEMMAQMQGLPPLDEVGKQSAIADTVKQQSLMIFGWEKPVTRQTLFRYMHCRVTVAMNTTTDRVQRLQGIQQVFASIQMGAQAAASAGMMFDPRPMLKLMAPLFNGDTDIAKMFKPMMAAPGMPGMPGAGLPPTVAGQAAPQPAAGDPGAGGEGPSENSAVSPVEVPGNGI